MLHEPANKDDAPDPAFRYKRRLGAIMFAIYASVYGAFIAVNVLVPRAMGAIVLAGLDLAVVWGFGLIVLAIVMALAYNVACGRREKAAATEGAK